MKKAQIKPKPREPIPEQPTQTVRLEAPIEGGESMMTLSRQLEQEEQRRRLADSLPGGWPEHSLGTS
ncbi:MAG: hypothetical protein AMXMBFR44_4970 [Candidatus Campbellbacteria bacterium]